MVFKWLPGGYAVAKIVGVMYTHCVVALVFIGSPELLYCSFFLVNL